MNVLRPHERQALDRAGFDPAMIDHVETVARETSWLGYKRWIGSTPVQIGVVCGAILLAFLVDFYLFTSLAMVIIVAPYLVEGAWRMATGFRDLDGRGARTALALSLRAKPEGQGGDGFAFAILRDAAKATHGLSGAEAVAALTRYQRKKDRDQLITGAIILAVLALILAMVIAPALVA
jgi:hypothetical protein